MEQLVSPILNEQKGEGGHYLRQALALKPLGGGRRNALRAVRLLEQGAAAAPDDPAYPYWCGVIYRSFGLWEKAVDYFRRALDVAPSHGPARLELGWALMQLGDFDAARATLMGGTESAGAADGASDASDAADWRRRRLEAILLLQEGRALEALNAYPAAPPEEVPVVQWWREYMALAEAAGADAQATVLERLEKRRHELEMLLGAGDRPSPHADELHRLWAVMVRLAAAAGDAAKAEQYRALVPRSSKVYRLMLDTWLRMTDQEAQEALERGDVETAVARWRRAVEEHPDDEARRGRLVHAICRLAADKWAQGDAEGAVALWSQARRLDVSSPELLHNLALGFERLGRWDDANKCRETYLQSLSRPSKDAPSEAVDQGAWLTAMAENAWRAGQRQQAKRLLDAAQQHLADDARLLTRAGLLYAALGDADKALHCSLAALKLQPGFAPALQCVLHVASAFDADDAAALNALSQALHGLPNDDPFVRDWRRRTLAYGRRALDSGMADAAMEAFASLLLADVADIEAWLWAGAAHLKRGNRNGAEDCFTEAIRLDPNRAATYIDLGARFLAEGDRPRAEQYFRQAVESAPGSSTHVVIGELCARIGVPELAEQHLRAALAGAQDAEPILVRAICGLMETGQDERVLPFLEEALRTSPDTVQLKILAAIQHLRRREWLPADERLREAETSAANRQDETLLDHVTYFRQSLILLRTIGRIDEAAFQSRTRRLLEEWRAEVVEADEVEDELPRRPLEEVLAELPPPVDTRPLLPPPPAEAEPTSEAGPDVSDLTVFFNMHVPPISWPDDH